MQLWFLSVNTLLIQLQTTTCRKQALLRRSSGRNRSSTARVSATLAPVEVGGTARLTMTSPAPVCSYPPEYCSYGSRLSKCKKWLSKAHPDLFTKYYGSEDDSAQADGDDATTASAEKKLEGLSLDEQKDAEKKEAKAEKKALKEQEKLANAKVTIKREQRTKRKMTTSILGLEAFSAFSRWRLPLASSTS